MKDFKALQKLYYEIDLIMAIINAKPTHYHR